MKIDIPNDVSDIYVLHSFPPITSRDKNCSIITTQDSSEPREPLQRLCRFNNLTYLTSPAYYEQPVTRQCIQIDDEHYYYTHGRTKNSFIVLVDKKELYDQKTCTRSQLRRRFKLFAYKTYKITANNIYAVCMHNFVPIDI